MKTVRIFCAAFLVMVFAPGCGDDISDSTTSLQECNPLGGQNCLLPFPIGLYQVDDSTTATGWRNDVAVGALPTNIDGAPLDPSVLNQYDGFATTSPILVAFDQGLDSSNLPLSNSIARSVDAASPTVIVNMTTGELVPHFIDIDVNANGTPSKQAVILRPVVMLDEMTRYAVAFRKSAKALDGSDLEISDGFQAILDDQDTGHDLLDRYRPQYVEIFAALEGVGVSRDDLVVAWDFGTFSIDTHRRDIIAARDAAMPAMGTAGSAMSYAVDRDLPGDASDPIARRIDGTFTSPLFLTNEGRFSKDTVISRDSAGLPMLMGTWDAPFTAVIPKCALVAAEPVPMFLYGHGLLGSANQVASGAIKDIAAENCYVAFGTDMRGMSENDVTNLALMLNNVNKYETFFPPQIQGILDHIALVQAARGPLAQTLFVDSVGNSIVDTSRIYYFGISQGGIFGSTIMSYDPYIERGVVQVGGINYSMMLDRSLDWPDHKVILEGAYPDPLDIQILIGILQNLWATDPANSAPDMLNGGIPGTPNKAVIMQMAVADVEVPNLSSELQARSMGIPVLGPLPIDDPFDLPVVTGTQQGGALTVWDFGLANTIPVMNEAPPDNDVHGDVRRYEAMVEQMRLFYATGDIVQTCTGENGCTCHDGGCGDRIDPQPPPNTN